MHQLIKYIKVLLFINSIQAENKDLNNIKSCIKSQIHHQSELNGSLNIIWNINKIPTS